MKTMFSAVVAMMSLLILGYTSEAMSRLPVNGSVTLEGRMNYPYLSSSGGRVYLQMTLASHNVRLPERQPMNICVVLDRSGSMADEGKITYAKKALYALIDQLTSKDILSIVIYDDVIEVLSPAKSVHNKNALKRLIERVEPRGSTNLGGGMIEGLRQAEQRFDREYVNRVILLSDGLANQGITDPSELNRIARRYRARSISLTTMGVGLEYNENLMMGLAESGGGSYYFIESPRNLASMIQKELHALSCVVAQNAFIELTLGKGVSVVDVIGCEYRPENGTYVISVGDLYANERRDFTVELHVPEGFGSLVVATGRLQYEHAGERIKTGALFSALVRYTHDVTEVEKNRDWDVQAKAEVAVSTRQVERAMQALDEGRRDDAVKEIATAKEMLSASPAVGNASGAGAAALGEQQARLKSYEEMLSGPADARQAKKAIQYDNYKTQKNKK